MSLVSPMEYLVPWNLRDRLMAVIYVCTTTPNLSRGPIYQRQVDNCMAFAGKAGLTIGAVYDDFAIRDVPLEQRPGLQGALTWLDAQPRGVLIVEDVGRLNLSGEDTTAFRTRLDKAGAAVVFVEEQRIGSPTDAFRSDIARAIQDYRAALVEQVMEQSVLLSPETLALLQQRARQDGQDAHHLADVLLSAALANNP